MNSEKNNGIESRLLAVTTSNRDEVAKRDQLAVETPIAFTYNGQSHAVMMASPLDLEDFAIGFSLTERIVDQPSQIRAIDIQQNKQGIAINMQIEPALVQRLEKQRRQMSGRSGCGICGISDLAAAIPNLKPMVAQAKPSYDSIATAAGIFNQYQPLAQLSGATHAAALFNMHGELLDMREDIGRHNAFDKLIGARLSKDGVANSDFALLSSRASHELITKSVIAGIPSLVAISAATTLAVDMASELNLNLVGFLRGKRQLIYHQNVV